MGSLRIGIVVASASIFEAKKEGRDGHDPVHPDLPRAVERKTQKGNRWPP